MRQVEFVLVMGVSGSGKSTIGKALAASLGWDFYDADDFHPPENIAKMAGGIPLTDADREPWLAALHRLIVECVVQNRPGVLACSALKERYRQILTAGSSSVKTVYLSGSLELIRARMAARSGHYMKAEMLQSQFDVLEEPQDALILDISQPIDVLIQKILAEL